MINNISCFEIPFVYQKIGRKSGENREKIGRKSGENREKIWRKKSVLQLRI